MKRGVSIILAMVLVIMIVIVVAASTYYWSIKIQGEVQAGAERSQIETLSDVSGEIEVKSLKHSSTLTNIQLVIQNIGTRELKGIGDIGDLLTIASDVHSCTLGFNSTYCAECPFDLGVGAVKSITIDFDGSACQDLRRGMQYNAYFSLGSDRVYTSFVADTKSNQWVQLNPPNKPSARIRHSMATISGIHKVVLFGGWDGSGNCDGSLSSFCSGTWVFDVSDNNWINMNPAVHPTARDQFASSKLYNTDKVLLFGGYNGTRNNETWIYDYSDNAWTQMNPASSPSARNYPALTAIYKTDKFVLFGGNDGALDDETWIYDYSDNFWINITPASSPIARERHAMATIDGTDKILLLGGFGTFPCEGSGSNLCGFTWVYDYSDNAWTQMIPPSSPSARLDYSMATIDGADENMLFGGWDGPSNSETWIYDYSRNYWTRKSIPKYPLARYSHAMATIDETESILLFGGQTAAGRTDDTWIYS